MKLVQIVADETRGTVRIHHRPGIIQFRPEEQALQVRQITERSGDVVFVWWILSGGNNS